MTRTTVWRAGAGALLALLLVAGTGQAASALPTARVTTDEGCLIPTPLGPLLGLADCAVPSPESTPAPDPSGTPTPTPTVAPSPAPTPTPPAGTGTRADGESDREASTPASDEPPAPAAPAPAPEPDPLAPLDEAAPVFTGDPATLSGAGLRIEGLQGIAIVSVRLADGSTERAIRLRADSIVVDGFRLDVPSGEGGLRNTATTLTVEGHVVVYTPSIRGILADGTERLIDTLTTPTVDELASLTRLTLPLRGMLADSITYDDSHQATF
ncbi:hypothetical protein [Microbacterium jejuense]|uniref:hypothetical protein n=1 Tax=Microbacterium jejuense TaxID=1263637 RepID=UPI0031E8E83E